ncbi:MAG: glycosyltransferase [Gammaproteobacteria bacterium]
MKTMNPDCRDGGSQRPADTQAATVGHRTESVPRVAIVILNLDARFHIQRLLQSLSRVHCVCFDPEVIVVDNGSTDGSVVVIQQELKRFHQSHLIINQDNVGAAEGRNQALRFLLESSSRPPPEYILTLDNDTIVEPQVIEDLVQRAERSSPEEMVFAPLLYFAGDPGRQWANWWTDGWRFPVQMEADWRLRDCYNDSKTVDGVATAAALIKTKAFRELSYFDERLFFGYEDLEWFQRVRRKGYEIKLVQVRGKVLHDCHQSLGGGEKGGLSPARIYYILRNMVLLMVLYSDPARLKPVQFVKLGRHICLYSLRTLFLLNWQGFKAVWTGLYDGLRRRTGVGRGAEYLKRMTPVQQPLIPRTKTPKTAYLYFAGVGLLTLTLAALYALTIDWSTSSVLIASFATCTLAYLLWGVADVIVQFLLLVIFRIWKGPLNHRRTDMSDGIPGHCRTAIAYMLRSKYRADCDEGFENMYRSYMDNLDPGGNLTAQLVSASTSLSVVQHELNLRDSYRRLIRKTLLDEAKIWKASYAEDTASVDDGPRARFWAQLFGDWLERGYSGEKLDSVIEGEVERTVRGYMYIHRTSTTLKKAGQYQDLMMLGSRGIDRPFTYLEETYGHHGRSPLIPTFGFCANLENDQELPEHEFERRVQELESRGNMDVVSLKRAGLTHGATEDISYRYTVLFDIDNRAPPGSIRTLVEIAAVNSERGFLQPGLLVSNMDTWHAFREILTHHTVSKMPEALFRAFGRFGDYGKGLADNEIFIEQFIGSPEAPKETLPYEILSHDTIEALYINPAYVPEVFFYEGVTTNAFSRQAQLARWTQGDLMNAVLLFPKSVGRAFLLARKLFYPSRSSNTCSGFTAPSVPATAHYIAHFSSRSLLRAPLFFLWIFAETFGQSVLVHTNQLLMNIHLYVVLLGLVLLPRMYKPLNYLVAGIRFRVLRQRNEAIRNINSSVRGFMAAWIEILTTPFVYMPDIIYSPVRLWLATKYLITGQASWKVQAEVERETQHVSFTTSLKKTWGYSVLAILFGLALWLNEAGISILLLTMLATWLVFLVTVWLSAKPMPARQRYGALLCWLLEDFDDDRLRRRDT